MLVYDGCYHVGCGFTIENLFYQKAFKDICSLIERGRKKEFGITEKYIGVSQLTLSLQILLEDAESLHAVQKRIYMVIAERFRVNWKSIKRNIRTLSTAAWRANPKYLELLAQHPLERHPTSVQFMETMLQNIRRKQA